MFEKETLKILSDAGILKNNNFYDPENLALVHHVNQALRANHIFELGKDYIIKDNSLKIIDELTGRILEGRRFGDGLHQALEAKEKIEIQAENQTLASITYQNYFKLYKKISGCTGTAATEAEEFLEIYNLPVVVIPTNKLMIRKDFNDQIFRTEKEKYNAITKKIIECNKIGQPVLVGTTSIEKSEKISEFLIKNNIKHNVLNAKQHEKEAEIVAAAGKPGAVTIATNMAGRGTDIKLGGLEEDKNYIYPLEAYEKLIDSNTRVVTVAWVTYGVGYRADLRALAELCHSRDALLFVDGVQGVGILNERIDDLGVDALSAGGHKAMFSLAGAGFLYVRKEIISQIDPPYAAKFSFTSNDRMKEKVKLAADAHRFEYGNPNYLGTFVQRRGCEFIKSIGLNHIEDRVKELSTFLIESALQRGYKIRTPRGWHQRAGIVSMDMGKDAQVIADSLAEQKIRVSCKDSHLRATVHFYNNEDDIVRYLDILGTV